MRWPWHRHGDDSTALVRAEAEAKLAATRKMTPVVARHAKRLGALSDDEFADRVAQAFRRRPT